MQEMPSRRTKFQTFSIHIYISFDIYRNIIIYFFIGHDFLMNNFVLIVDTGQIDTIVPPKRPDHGTKGRVIQLKANFFELNLPKNDIHHYDVAITPEKCPRAVNHAVVQTMVDKYHKMFGGQKPVYDGRKNLYSQSPLPIDKERVCLRCI